MGCAPQGQYQVPADDGADEPRYGKRDGNHRDDRHEVRGAERSRKQEAGKAGVSPERENVRMSELYDVNDAKVQGEPRRNDGVDEAQHHEVDEMLEGER